MPRRMLTAFPWCAASGAANGTDRIGMSNRSECGLAAIQVGYQISPDEAGGWALTLRVAELPGGLLADQLGRTLVAMVQGTLEPAASMTAAEVAH